MILERLAPCKINLGLHVLRRREDGYHDLETVFLRLPWSDHLTARPAARITLTCSDPLLPTDEGNLCVRAARRLAGAYGVASGAALHLEKRVPYGSGLGGGSSDAAATLRLLSALWGLEPDEKALHEIAAGLGSDVPFFLGPPAACAAGRGERLTPLLDAAGKSPYTFPYELVVAAPEVRVSTAEAYRRVRPNAENRPDLCALVASNSLARWRAELVNDFEASVFEAYPAVQSVRDALLDAGAAYAALSGSGSAVFGVFDDPGSATAAAEAARATGHEVWQGVP